jgi:ribosomal protein S18 acetylase RimI-like enzyme
MTELPEGFRPATVDDADAMAELVNYAGEGLPLYLWRGMADPGESAWDVGRARARRDTGGFSWRNTVVCEVDGEVVACLIGYPLPDVPEVVDYADLPAMFVPLQELEDLAPGTWYINVLATRPAHRGRGLGGALLEIASRLARDTRCRGSSLIVADSNTHARRLYEHHGYREVARRPMVKDGFEHPGREWVLMTRTSSQPSDRVDP